MESIVAKVRAQIFGSKNGWSLGADAAQGRPVVATECEVLLEIQGTRKHGYHLIMAPQGFFTADHWFESKQEALDNAQELFDLPPDSWVVNEPKAAP